jgi:TRAP-type transport system small permease protein
LIEAARSRDTRARAAEGISMDETINATRAVEPVLDEEGHFHATDAPIELSHYVIEDWVALGFFWLLGLCVFYQFFTRYALNDSAAWTEEISRYLLIATVFIGLAAAVRHTRHIHVDFLYRLVPKPVGRALSTLIDLLRIAFFAVAVGLTIQMMTRMTSLMMTIIDLPVNIVYAVCAVGFAAATVRAVQVTIENWKRGYSVLERPEIAIEETIE